MANAIGGFGAFVRAIRAAVLGAGGGFRQLEPLFATAASIDPGTAASDTPLEIGVGGVATPGGGAIGDIGLGEIQIGGPLGAGPIIEGAGGFGSVGTAATVFTFGTSFQGLAGASRALSIFGGFGLSDLSESILRGVGSSFFGVRITSEQSGGGGVPVGVGIEGEAGGIAAEGSIGTPIETVIEIGTVIDVGDLDSVETAIQQAIRRAGGLMGLERAFAFGEFVRKVLAQPFEGLGLSAITRPQSFVGFRTIADVPPPEPQVPAYPVWGQVGGEGALASG